jgi:long-chain acyl-CoA synthetase
MDRRATEAAFEHEALEWETLSELLASTAARHPDGVAQSYKGGVYDRSLVEAGAVSAAPTGDYADLTYSELETIVQRLATGFGELGLGVDDRLSIVSHTRMEWTQVDLATLAAGGVVTTVYPSATDDRLEYLLSDSEPTGIVVENGELLGRVLGVESALNVDFIVVIDSLADGSGMAGAVRDRDDIHTLGTVYDRGAAAFDADSYESLAGSREPGDLASIIYTSGTTGQPKGVRLTHRNFRANVDQTFRRFGPRPDRVDSVPRIDHTGRHLSVLPLAHVFERLVGQYLMVAAGSTIAYAESPETLSTDFQLVSPTSSTAVPQLYERLFEAFETRASRSLFGERLFGWAIDIATQYHHTEDPSRRLRLAHSIADRLVYSELRDALGGKMELFISGGSSLSVELCAAFHGMGLPILEGYGLTETAPVVSANPPEDPRVGTIGPPLCGIETRLDSSVSVGDFEDALDTEAVDNEQATVDKETGTVGELLVRGPNVTPGYWKRPEATAEAFVSLSDDESDGSVGNTNNDQSETDDRWFRTGDLVERRPSGYLVFRNRIKQLVVLSTGKNVAPGPIEAALVKRPVVAQCLLVGDGRPAVGALIVPDFDALGQWAEREGIELPTNRAAIVDEEWVNDRIRDAVEAANNGFEPHERIGQFRLVAESFTVDNDLLTPTMKKRRHSITEQYADQVGELYRDQ